MLRREVGRTAKQARRHRTLQCNSDRRKNGGRSESASTPRHTRRRHAKAVTCHSRSLRCHVGGWRRCCRQRLCAVRTPGLRQAGALACDDRRGAIFERCVRNEQQPDENETNNGQEGESWHCRAPTIRSSTPHPVAKPRLDNRSSWTMGLRMRVRPLADRSTRGQRQYRPFKSKDSR